MAPPSPHQCPQLTPPTSSQETSLLSLFLPTHTYEQLPASPHPPLTPHPNPLVSCPPGCPYLLTSFHDSFLELQPDQTPQKAILTVSLSCLWVKSRPSRQIYAAASAVHPPWPLHFSGPNPKLSLCPRPSLIPGLVGLSWPQWHLSFPHEPTDHAMRFPC